MNEDFKIEFRQLEENKDIEKKVYEYLVEKGLDTKLKGFDYLKDIITLSLIKKKYSRTTIKELTPFIAFKYGIKEYSVQRQLRYVCSIKQKYYPVVICNRAWSDIRAVLEEEKEKR